MTTASNGKQIAPSNSKLAGSWRGMRFYLVQYTSPPVAPLRSATSASMKEGPEVILKPRFCVNVIGELALTAFPLRRSRAGRRGCRRGA